MAFFFGGMELFAGRILPKIVGEIALFVGRNAFSFSRIAYYSGRPAFSFRRIRL